eukprot:m51a1_g3646 hypothetical protein (714) ;mRNA; f:193996-196641
MTERPRTSTSTSVPVKVTHAALAETRRFVLEVPAGCAGAYARLCADVASLYSLAPAARVALKYVDDDGDHVTLASDADVAEALRGVPPAGALCLLLSVGAEDAGQQQQQQQQGHQQQNEDARVAELVAALWQRRERIAALMPRAQMEQLTRALSAIPPPDACAAVTSALASSQVQAILPHIAAVLADAVTRSIEPRSLSPDPSPFGITCSVCKTPITGARFKCLTCVDFSMCEGCERLPGTHDPSHPLLKGRCQSALASVFCPTAPFGGYGGASTSPASLSPRGHSGSASGEASPRYATSSPAAALPASAAAAAAPEEQRASRWCGVFVEDVTLPPDALMQASQRRVKIWRVRNTGADRWPLGCRVEQVSGESVALPNPALRVPQADPGRTADIAAEIRTPSAPGAYETQWRVTDPEGLAVVPALRLRITVPEDQGSAAPPPYASIMMLPSFAQPEASQHRQQPHMGSPVVPPYASPVSAVAEPPHPAAALVAPAPAADALEPAPVAAPLPPCPATSFAPPEPPTQAVFFPPAPAVAATAAVAAEAPRPALTIVVPDPTQQAMAAMSSSASASAAESISPDPTRKPAVVPCVVPCVVPVVVPELQKPAETAAAAAAEPQPEAPAQAKEQPQPQPQQPQQQAEEAESKVDDDYIPPEAFEEQTPLEVFAELGLDEPKQLMMRQLESMGFTNFEKLLPHVRKASDIQDVLNKVLS